jgi:hypothetical protein
LGRFEEQYDEEGMQIDVKLLGVEGIPFVSFCFTFRNRVRNFDITKM